MPDATLGQADLTSERRGSILLNEGEPWVEDTGGAFRASWLAFPRDHSCLRVTRIKNG